MSALRRGRIDDLRRAAVSVLDGLGLPAVAAAALADHLLWFDQAGLCDHGLRRLSAWVDEIRSGRAAPLAVPRVTREAAATACLDAARAIGPLALDRAAEIAMQKAREVGAAVVRVTNLGLVGPAAPVVARIAIGPYAGLALSSSAWSFALPTGGGLPFVGDSHWCDGVPLVNASPLIALLGADEWLVQALSVTAIESLAVVQERVRSVAAGPQWLTPARWEPYRARVAEEGVELDAATWSLLN